MLSTSELSILQADKEIAVYAKRTIKMFGIAKDVYALTDEEKYSKQYERIDKYESISDRMEVEIASYLTKVAEGRLSDLGKKDVHDDANGNVIGLSSASVKEDGINSFNVCLDAVAVIVNKSNDKVNDLTLEQLYDIYTGKVTKFSEVVG